VNIPKEQQILAIQRLDINCGRWHSYDVTFVWLKLEWVYSKW